MSRATIPVANSSRLSSARRHWTPFQKKALQNLRHHFRRWEDLANSSHEIIFHSSGRFITREQSTQSPCWGSILDDEKS
jgi:hypothetical protein